MLIPQLAVLRHVADGSDDGDSVRSVLDGTERDFAVEQASVTSSGLERALRLTSSMTWRLHRDLDEELFAELRN